jgi:cyclic pyranopterin phosphate synthase
MDREYTMNNFTHLTPDGEVRMVDVGAKPISARSAIASARVRASTPTLKLLREQALPKGDAIATMRIAGILAAKQTSVLIPLCHTVPLDAVSVDIEICAEHVDIRTRATTHGQTGVEMEALVAASVAALTLYDMCKAVDRDLVIEYVRLEEKHGGVRGDYCRED